MGDVTGQFLIVIGHEFLLQIHELRKDIRPWADAENVPEFSICHMSMVG